MPYDPGQIANYFLDLANVEGVSLDALKLQKLLYFAHGWHLAVTGEPLLNEPIEAWPYGPVVPSIYHAFKRFGMEPIKARVPEVSWDPTSVADLPEGPEHDETRAVLRRVWDVHKGLSGLQLSTLSHAPGSPWDQVAQKHGGRPRSTRIPNETIRNFFVAQARAQTAAQ